MSTFAEIIERKLGAKVKDKRTAISDIAVHAEAKGLKLKATFNWELRNEEEGNLAGFEQDAFDAASRRVEELLDGIIFQDVFDSDRKIVVRNKGRVKVPDTAIGLRDNKGRIISGLQLSRILNLTLTMYVQQLMGTQGRLVNRTGRLANSAQVNRLAFRKAEGAERKNRVSIFFQYMIAPYRVFEPGHVMHKPGRSPVTLIKAALMNALKAALNPTSFKTTIFNIHNEDL